MFYEPHARDRAVLPHDPFKAMVAPRPVGWVSTAGPDGAVNLAPYSFFNAVGEPPARDERVRARRGDDGPVPRRPPAPGRGVAGVHVDEAAIVDGRFDTAGVQPVARCGYKGDYAVVTELFEMLRPA